MIDDRSHAFGDRLILQMNAVDAAVDRAVVLRLAVDVPVVRRVGFHPEAAEPVRRVGQELVAAPGADDANIYRGARAGYFVSDDKGEWQDVYTKQLAAGKHPPTLHAAE